MSFQEQVTFDKMMMILLLKGWQKGFWLNWYNLLISRVTPFSIYFMDSNNDMNNIACFTSIAISL
jgi:hypothetical protein